jgi:photosynthetic reaction center cytochrome c subunit
VNLLARGAGLAIPIGLLSVAGYLYHKTNSVQTGYPGVGMQLVQTNAQIADKASANVVPAALPPASQDGQRSIDAYKNVQVLGHISSGEMTRLMTAMANWVAPNDGGCAYCHAHEKDAKGNDVKDEDGAPQADLKRMDSDELYPKRVARRMLQMTMRINGEWKEHVKATGVTCFTCHRGKPVPANIWFDVPDSATDDRLVGSTMGQNKPALNAGLTSLPSTSFRPFLASEENIRVISTEPVGSNNHASIKQAEWTYGLMMDVWNALGVNCTHCHNTRSMGEWSVSPPTRAQAWYGIRMVREINLGFLEPLLPEFPANRLGPLGDAPKANCATCHNGVAKPLQGVSMLKDYEVLAEAKPQPAKTVVLTSAPLGGLDADGGAMALGDAGALMTAPAALDGGPGGDAGAKKPGPPPKGPRRP